MGVKMGVGDPESIAKLQWRPLPLQDPLKRRYRCQSSDLGLWKLSGVFIVYG